MFLDSVFGKDSGIWAESSEKWDEAHPSWKIVGHDPRRVSKSEICLQDMSQELFHKSSIEHIFEYDGRFDIENCVIGSIKPRMESVLERKCFYLIAFTSGKTCMAVSPIQVDPGSFVIIEADRGEDCVQVKECIKSGSGEMKNILRKATEKDIEILEKKKIQEVKAMEKCNFLVKERGLPMGITGCEFQWDMKKITFYFRSDKRVDFRELVNDLFKYFKVRIWMSMENRK